VIEIRCRCTSCTEVCALTLAELLLVLPDAPEEPGPRIVHGCHHCGATTVRDVDDQLAGLLLSHGITAAPHLAEPAGEPHPENPPAGAPFTADDVIELHELLLSAEWFDRLAAAVAEVSASDN